MEPLRMGRHVARAARTAEDLRAAQRLRHHCFIDTRPGSRPRPGGLDADAFDARCLHMMIEEADGGRLVCCFRLMPLSDGSEIGRSYSAQFYELSALGAFGGRMAELGRFCTHPEHGADPDILRLAWAALARFVDAERVELLFGCSSFEGVDAARHHDAFALLRARHIAPRRWLPRIKAPRVFPFGWRLRHVRPDPRRAFAALPPLLRSYLAMGGWVSDHAVVDPDLNTLHVFTGLEVRAIPPARARLLRAVAAGA
jgi:putative hemolysin